MSAIVAPVIINATIADTIQLGAVRVLNSDETARGVNAFVTNMRAWDDAGSTPRRQP
jgi:hypothetical protein